MTKDVKKVPAVRRGVTRRQVVKTAAAIGIAASVGPFVIPRPAKAAKTLKILQWVHFVPRSDKWFNNPHIKEWVKAHVPQATATHLGI